MRPLRASHVRSAPKRTNMAAIELSLFDAGRGSATPAHTIAAGVSQPSVTATLSWSRKG